MVWRHQRDSWKRKAISHLQPGLDWTRLFMSLTAGAGTRCMSLLSSSPSLVLGLMHRFPSSQHSLIVRVFSFQTRTMSAEKEDVTSGRINLVSRRLSFYKREIVSRRLGSCGQG